MNELEATRAKLKCLEMVEGTELDWWKCIKHRGYVLYSYPSVLVADKCEYEFALGVIEGKPVWKGDTYYHSGYRFTANLPMEKLYYLECSWGPPTPKNEKADELCELLTIQKRACDCVNDPYFRGMYNGMEVMLACVEDRAAKFIDKPKPKTVMVEMSIDLVKHAMKYTGWTNMLQGDIGKACCKAWEELK